MHGQHAPKFKESIPGANWMMTERESPPTPFRVSGTPGCPPYWAGVFGVIFGVTGCVVDVSGAERSAVVLLDMFEMLNAKAATTAAIISPTIHGA